MNLSQKTFVMRLIVLMICCAVLVPAMPVSAQVEVPVAVEDEYWTLQNVPLIVDVPGVLFNDIDPLGQGLTAELVSDVLNGELDLNPDGSFTYTPDIDFCSLDTFEYRAVDGDGVPSELPAFVYLNVVCDVEENEPPVAADDIVTTDEDVPVMFDVLINDMDPDGNLYPPTAAATSDPANGTLIDHGNGVFTYTPATNWFGMDGFDYEVCDALGLCDTATVSITVNPVNDAPVCDAAYASPDTLWPVNHKAVSVTILGVTDVDGDAITISFSAEAVDSNEPANGTGDGNTETDWGIGGDGMLWLLAERSGNGNGRTYTIEFTATDEAKASCDGRITVVVPHDQGNDPGMSEESIVDEHPGNAPDHSNAGGNSDKDTSPPDHSNAGGNHDKNDKDTSPPDHSNAGGNKDKDKKNKS